MSLLGVLAVIFIVLKLVGVICWSWWLILAPLYGIPTIVLFLMVVGGIGATVGRRRY